MKTLSGLLLAVIAATASAAEPGVGTTRISIGMSAPLTGPLANYGTQLRRGLALGLEQVNAVGGIAGRENDRRGSRFVEMTIVTADGRFRR